MGGNKRVVFGALLLVGFCCLFLLTITSPELELRVPGVGVSKALLAVNYVSKRRVPNGPDPIHNRKIGNARETPERA